MPGITHWHFNFSVEGPEGTPYNQAHPKDALFRKGPEKEKAYQKCQYCSLQILGTQSSNMRSGIILFKRTI